MKKIMRVLEVLSAVTIFLTIVSVGKFLVEHEIVSFTWSWIEYPYYFGLGVISYYPIYYVFNFRKDKYDTTKKHCENGH